jgi:hypothetical protein
VSRSHPTHLTSVAPCNHISKAILKGSASQSQDFHYPTTTYIAETAAITKCLSLASVSFSHR